MNEHCRLKTLYIVCIVGAVFFALATIFNVIALAMGYSLWFGWAQPVITGAGFVINVWMAVRLRPWRSRRVTGRED